MGFLFITIIALTAGIAEAFAVYKKDLQKKRFNCAAQTFIIIEGLSLLFAKLFPPVKHFLDTGSFTIKKYILLIFITLIISAFVCFFVTFIEKNNQYDNKSANHKKLFSTITVISFILFSVGICALMGAAFIKTEWGNTRPDQLVVNMLSPTVGTEFSIYLQGFEFVLIALGLIGIFAVFCFKKLSLSVKSKQIFSGASKSIISAFVAVSVFVTFGVFAEHFLNISRIYKSYFVNSDFLEEKYVNPSTTNIEFPSEKRNLIYFYLESMENTYLDKSLGGYMDENLMPNLTELSHTGLKFSNTENEFGGPLEITGSSWSLASMVNNMLGIPMKPPTSISTYSTENMFIPGAVGIGDLLKEEGYNQTVLIGSDARFGGLNYLYKTHGDYKIFDYEYAKDNGYIPKDYYVWWGFEDSKLYEFAKKELTALYKEGKPFNLTMENANTHMPDGYLPPNAPKTYDSPYANAINYSQKEVADFIKWIQEQPFYENTTIILIGDHKSMDVDFFKDFDKNYLRTQYLLILNPDPSVDNTPSERFINRRYSNIDMFPTTLAAMGCKIEGDRLGIGTNLFSDKKTLIEEYGQDYVNSELLKKSTFYSKTLCE